MRQQYKTKPYEKLMEVYQRFDGGLNTMSAPDTMLDTELTDILNRDIGERGSLRRRHGLRKVRSIPFSGNVQGYFRYYKTDGTFDEICVRNGYFYRNDESNLMKISGAIVQMQATRQMEAAQTNGILYIATGTKLLAYDGTELKYVDPYKPDTMETTHIGSNILANVPEEHMKDYIGLVPSIDYMIPKFDGKNLYAKVFFTGLSGESYQFALQIKSTKYRATAWSDPAESKWMAKFSDDRVVDTDQTTVAADEYDVRVLMRKLGRPTPILSEIVITVDTRKMPANTPPTIQKCNRIFQHWGRLMMYGDPDHPTTLYMSHYNEPTYFPALSNLDFDNPRREPLTTIIHYRNSLLVFTKSSTQALYGTGPDDFRRVMLHTDLGCISPYGAVTMRNHVGFLSLQGIYALKTLGLTDDKATVEKLDGKISNMVTLDTDAVAVFADNQLQITFPSRKERLRFYYDLGSWTKDYSEYFNFARQYNIDGEIYCLTQVPKGQVLGGHLYVFDKNVYNDDDYVYTDMWESKYFSFGQPYHKKKLKEIHILTAPKDTEMNCKVSIYADEEAVITPGSGQASIVDGAVVWNVNSTNNFNVSVGTTFGDKWELGENAFGPAVFSLNKLKLTGNCKRTRIRVMNTEPNENQFVGFAYIFKIRRPG